MFDLVVTAMDVDHPKPHPEQLHKVVDYFNVMPENILFIGDSEVDAGAAAAAGVPLVAYGNPLLQAAYHVDSLKAVEGILGLGM
jgi:phosphoglycolate phosphatase-like HAD superfamily hydrolase